MEESDENVLCNYQVGGGGFGSSDLDPPEYCDQEIDDPDEDYCPGHLKMVWDEEVID
jgi:hypothetical protein